MSDIPQNELRLMAWLQFDDGLGGECRGRSLDALLDRHFVEWTRRDARGDDYSYLGLTVAGREALAAAQAACPHPGMAADTSGTLRCYDCGQAASIEAGPKVASG